MFFEMDGSFVWAISPPTGDPETKEQLDGMLYDRAGRVEYLELKGTADYQHWIRIACALIGIRTKTAFKAVGRKPQADLSTPPQDIDWEELERSLKIYDVQSGAYVSVIEALT